MFHRVMFHKYHWVIFIVSGYLGSLFPIIDVVIVVVFINQSSTGCWLTGCISNFIYNLVFACRHSTAIYKYVESQICCFMYIIPLQFFPIPDSLDPIHSLHRVLCILSILIIHEFLLKSSCFCRNFHFCRSSWSVQPSPSAAPTINTNQG